MLGPTRQQHIAAPKIAPSWPPNTRTRRGLPVCFLFSRFVTLGQSRLYQFARI
jgi:hypothetical protein